MYKAIINKREQARAFFGETRNCLDRYAFERIMVKSATSRAPEES